MPAKIVATNGVVNPLVAQIEMQIKEQVAIGARRPGERLPTADELAAELGASRGTVQRAYELLTRDGVIRSVAGVGPYGAEKALENRKCLYDVAGQLLATTIGRCKSLGCDRSEIEQLMKTWLDKWFLASAQP
ncbi:MAG: GntR family transcriptional regulator [Candidatus Eremiobacteraeota bacterium]|nr:GntR family transcriptional regulator [Candidatus Eremiobacteraeota bacterium]